MCNQNENTSHLDQMNESLLKDIETIINKRSAKVSASYGIMERLRGETIFIPKEYKDKLKGEQLKDKKYPVTINPYKCLPISLTQIEKGSIAASGLDLIKKGVIQIKANSFGPFNPGEYFEIDRKYRIVWVLKEPYIKSDSWYNGDRGGHNQAAEYRNWEDAKSIQTYRNLIKYTKILLENLGISYKGEVDEIMNKVMSHICLLEVNHFPGLSFNDTTDSNDEYMAEWYKINKSLLQKLVDFYDPFIIIFGHTLENFDEFDDFKEVYKRYTQNKLVILGDTIVEWSYNDPSVTTPTVSSEKNGTHVGRNVRYYVKGGNRIYIQAYHPVACDFGPEYAEADSKVINEWRNSRNETD